MSGMTKAARRERERKVVEIIARAAAEGRACPGNADLARVMGVDSPGTASAIMSAIQRRGLIKIERFATRRIVTIVATGQRTAGEAGHPHWCERNPAGARNRKPKPSAIKPAPVAPPSPGATRHAEPVRVDREPCTWCGVRADVGCKHTRAADLGPSVEPQSHAAAH